MRIALLIVSFIIGFAPSASASGSLSTTDLLNHLRATNPKLVQSLETGFKLDADAMGETVGRSANTKLAGTRVGPYRLTGSLAGVRVVITLNTEVTFNNSAGVRTSHVAGAKTVNEKLKSITVTASDVTKGNL